MVEDGVARAAACVRSNARARARALFVRRRQAQRRAYAASLRVCIDWNATAVASHVAPKPLKFASETLESQLAQLEEAGVNYLVVEMFACAPCGGAPLTPPRG